MCTIIIIINPLTAKVSGGTTGDFATSFLHFSACYPLPSGTCQTPGLSIPWCCLPTSSSVCLVFFPLSLCRARWFWPDLMNGKHDRTTAVCISLQWPGGLCVCPIACWILAWTSSLVTWSLYEMCSILQQHLISMACILLWSSAVRVHDSQAYRKMDVTTLSDNTNNVYLYLRDNTFSVY